MFCITLQQSYKIWYHKTHLVFQSSIGREIMSYTAIRSWIKTLPSNSNLDTTRDFQYNKHELIRQKYIIVVYDATVFLVVRHLYRKTTIAVKTTISLEFAVTTFDAEQYFHLLLRFKVEFYVNVNGDWRPNIMKNLIVLFFHRKSAMHEKRHNKRIIQNNQKRQNKIIIQNNQKRHNKRIIQNNQNKYVLNNTKTVICGSHPVLVVEPGLLGFSAMWSGNFFPTFVRKVPSSQSGLWAKWRTHNPK